MKLKVLVNDEVNEIWFDRMIQLEHKMFPEDGPDFLSADYLRGLYKESKDGLFFCIDEETDRLAGYLTIIFIDEKQKKHYLDEGGHFSELFNRGMKLGSNIMYIYTAAFDEDYRGSHGMKLIGQKFAKWLDEKETEGCFADEVYSEAVSLDGVRTIVHGFNMKPYHIDEKGLGHYQSKDRLKEYRERMKK